MSGHLAVCSGQRDVGGALPVKCFATPLRGMLHTYQIRSLCSIMMPVCFLELNSGMRMLMKALVLHT